MPTPTTPQQQSKRRIPFYILDSFTDTPFAGNPAGVFFDDAGALTAEEMQRMAGEVSLESAFVSPPDADGDDGATFRLRYFTGACEVPLCGHATVAAVTALHRAGRVSSDATLTLQTNVGALPVLVAPSENNGVTVTLFQTPREFGPSLADTPFFDVVATALGCATGDLVTTAPFGPRRVSTGTPWLLAPVASRAVVDAAPGNRDAIVRLSQDTNTFGLYVFAFERNDATGEAEVWSRCFAPVAGLDEDPVTGSGAGALGLYLHRAGLFAPGDTLTIQQGFGGGRGGTVCVGLQMNELGDALGAVTVTGTAVLVAEGAFVLP